MTGLDSAVLLNYLPNNTRGTGQKKLYWLRTNGEAQTKKQFTCLDVYALNLKEMYEMSIFKMLCEINGIDLVEQNLGSQTFARMGYANFAIQ